MMVLPVWTRSLPPEVDDTLTYVLKSRQLVECFNQDCPALNDLRFQLSYGRAAHPPSYEERMLAFSRIFPVYHPLFSVLIAGIKKTGLSWMDAYRAIWTAAPLFFGLAFAYFLATLWGLSAAGLALGLLAFKVFPDTGLNLVVPSNVAAAIALIIWARIFSKKGKALIALIVGSILLILTHTVGIIYAVMSIFLTLCLSQHRFKAKTWSCILGILAFSALIFFISDLVNGPHFVQPDFLPKGPDPLAQMFVGAGQNFVRFAANVVRMEDGLFGSFSIFCGSVLFGILTVPPEKRRAIIRTILILALFVFGLMFYVSCHPADVIFRIWIPLVILLFGAVGQAVCYTAARCRDLLADNHLGDEHRDILQIKHLWPAIALAVLLGYSAQMCVRGGEQVYATTRHMIESQPLRFDPSQPELLLSRAKRDERVLYTSMIAMPYYFIHGAMDLGAVYYHPSMKDAQRTKSRLKSPDLRFAVTYNPTVYHPSFEGRPENEWWTQAPAFYFSPLNNRRQYGPISSEGRIPASGFLWIDVFPRGKRFPGKMRLELENSGKSCEIAVSAIQPEQGQIKKGAIKRAVPAEWSGDMLIDVRRFSGAGGLRIVLPGGETSLSICGLTFNNTQLHWPWELKAKLCFMAKDPNTGRVCLSFNPEDLLPEPLDKKEIAVLDDTGSSVLFEIH